MIRWTLSLVALAALALAATPAIAADGDKKPAAETAAPAAAEVGKAAPKFSLTDQNGATHSLADNKGKVSVLIWHNPECPFVVRHLKADSYNKLRQQFPAEDVKMLLVDSSNFVTADKARESATENKLTVPVGLDADGKVGHLYGAKTTPHVYVINKEGVLVYAGAIDNDPRGDKPAAEVENYAAEAIKAALAGEPVKTSSTKPYGCSVKYAKQTADLGKKLDYLLAGKACDGDKTSQTMTLAGKDCDKTTHSMILADCGKCEKDKPTSTSLILAGKDCCPDGSTSSSLMLACGDKGKDGTKEGTKDGATRVEELILACGDKGKDGTKEGTKDGAQS